jgi:hypothetical protein
MIDGVALPSVTAGVSRDAGCTASCHASVITPAATHTATVAIASFPPDRNPRQAARRPRNTRTISAITSIHTGPVVRATARTRPAATASHHAARWAFGSVAASSATHQAIPAADSAPLVLIADMTSTDVGPTHSAIEMIDIGPGRARSATRSAPSSSRAARRVNVSRPSSSAAVVDVARCMTSPAGTKMKGW